MPRMGSNLTSPLLSQGRNGTFPTLTNSTNTNTTTDESDLVPTCRECPNSAGICCPPNAQCDELGKCPWVAMEAMGYILHGRNQVNWRNLSDGSYLTDATNMPLSGDVDEAARLGSEAGSSQQEHKRGFEGMGMRDTGPVLAQREKELRERQARGLKVAAKQRAPGQGYLVGGDA